MNTKNWVRGSELQDFLRCRLRWQWAWVENLESKKANNKLLFGTMMHKFLEGWHQHVDYDYCLKKAFAEADGKDVDPVEYQEIDELLRKVSSNYATMYAFDTTEYEVLATEFQFAIPLGNGMGYTGTIDLLLRERATGHIWFSDHKTTSSIEKYDKNSDLDRQISRYWWALQQLSKGKGYIRWNDQQDWKPTRKHFLGRALQGIEPYGFFYNIVLKDFPVPPKVLASGKLSTDKRQKTTYEMYCNAIAENYLSFEDYNEMLQHLRDNPKEFFRRTRVVRNQTEIDLAMAEAIATMREQRSVRNKLKKPHDPDKTPVYRNITTDCSWDCPFFELCKASLDGSNVEFLKESLFQEKVQI